MQNVSRAIRLKCPDLHLAEALSAELRLTAQRLLGDEGVRPNRTRVDLVIHQVRQLKHVDVTHGRWLLERVTQHAIEELRLARARQASRLQQCLDLGLLRPVEHRRAEPDTALHARGHAQRLHVVEVKQLVQRGRASKARLEQLADLGSGLHLRGQVCDLHAKLMRSPAKMRLEDLSDVHTRRHAQRVQNDLDRCSIRKVRHVFFGQNARDHALVAVAPGHLVADTQLALHRDVYLHHLDYARAEFVAFGHLADLLVGDLAQHVDLPRRHLLDLIDLLIHPWIFVRVANALQIASRDEFNHVAVKNLALV